MGAWLNTRLKQAKTNEKHRPLWNRVTPRVMLEDTQHFARFPKCFTIFSQHPSISWETRNIDMGKPYNILLPKNSCRTACIRSAIFVKWTSMLTHADTEVWKNDP